jgi:peptidoglycan/LPS O-acetylase OafA/YrhL
MISQHNEKSKVYFSGINLLRFIAAFSIIVYHCTLEIQHGEPSLYKTILHNLVLGVDMFFIISGFLITYLLIIEKKRTKKISLIKFYVRRALRIFPLYFLIVLLSYFLFSAENPQIDYKSHFYFLGNFSLISHSKWSLTSLNPLWSICIEEHFYLFIPVLAFILPVHKLKYLFIGIIIISIGFRAYSYFTLSNYWMTIYVHTLSRCDVIAIGGLIALFYNNKGNKINISSYILPAAVLSLLIALCYLDYNNYNTLLYVTLKKYAFTIPLVLIFISIVFYTKKSSIVYYLINNRLIDYLGKISYGLYMYHSIVYYFLCEIEVINNSTLIKLISVTIISIFISAISYESFEKEIMKYKKKFEVIQTKKSLPKSDKLLIEL